MLALPATAAAENGWEAQFIDQSAYLTLESGETGTSSFVARNIGSGTWDPAFVRLGTTNPRDRSSGLADATLDLSAARHAGRPGQRPARRGRLLHVHRARARGQHHDGDRRVLLARR